MKKLPRLLTLAMALSLGTAAFAQTSTTDASRGGRPGGPGGPGGRGPRGNPIVRALDVDKNQELSAAEIANAPAVIRTLDANSDGKVAADELRPARPADAPERPANAPVPPADATRPQPTDPVMLALDANADGDLAATEIANAATSLAALDLNKDGKLTPDEIRPLPPEGAPAQKGPGGPRGGR